MALIERENSCMARARISGTLIESLAPSKIRSHSASVNDFHVSRMAARMAGIGARSAG